MYKPKGASKIKSIASVPTRLRILFEMNRKVDSMNNKLNKLEQIIAQKNYGIHNR